MGGSKAAGPTRTISVVGRWCGGTRVVLATGMGNQLAVEYLAGGSVQFGSRPRQIPDPHGHRRFNTRTGHTTVGF